MTEFNLLIDSSVWLGYHIGNMPNSHEIIESEDNILKTSILSIYEMAKRLEQLGKKPAEIRKAIQFIEDNSTIVNLTKDICLEAVENSLKHKLHAIDSIIYTSAISHHCTFVTADNDFRGLPSVFMIET